MLMEHSHCMIGESELHSFDAGYAVLNLLSDGRIASCNPTAVQMFGLESSELVGRPLASLLHKTEPLSPHAGRGPDSVSAISALRADGSPFPVVLHCTRIDPAAGDALVIIRDVTLERKARELMRKLTLAVEQTADSVMITDRNGIIDYVNHAFEQVTGYTRAEALGRTGNIVKSGFHDAHFYRELWKTIRSGNAFRAVFRNRRKSGQIYCEEKTITPIRDDSGEISHFVSTAKEVTDRINEEERLNRLANYDGLTGLPNRALFMDRLQGALAAAKRNNRLIGLFFMDLDRFKSVNDTLGHAAGDKFLVEIAERLNGCLRATDTVARFGGDEFVFIINDLKAKADVEQVLKKIFDAFHVPVIIGDHEIPASASIGVSLYPQDGITADELLKRADVSMYHAKAAGNNLHCYHIPRSKDESSPCMQSID